MTDLSGLLENAFNNAAKDISSRPALIDPAKLMEASERLQRLLDEEDQNRRHRHSMLEEQAEQLRQATSKIFGRVLDDDEDPMAVFQQINEERQRKRVTTVQETVAHGTARQVQAPMTAKSQKPR
ncbi:MAG TPA: hypothetical protein VEF76_12725 [Patescibacteria group bacterium]|nr:hypothetical protein [Patescibacteria group bacterium]